MFLKLEEFLTRHRGVIVRVVAISMSVVHLSVAVTGAISGFLLNAIHVSFAMVLAYLIYPFSPSRKGRLGIPDVLMALLSLLVFGYIVLDYENISNRMALLTPFANWQFALGIIATLLVLEAGRRVVGWTLTILAGVMLFYAYFSPYFPSILRVKGWTLRQIAEVIYFTGEGILGIPIGVSATFIFLFVVLGAFLNKGGGGKFFMNLAIRLTGRSKGGPAKIAVVASALFGTISGSAVANVVSTGNLTIPLMKRTGYRPHVAGAIEAVASSGGQLMPPVMGAAAFVMAEITSTPYSQIIRYALLPALLYYMAVFTMVHLEAVKHKMVVEKVREDTDYMHYFHMIIPVLILLGMIVVGYTPYLSATVAVFLSMFLSFLRKETRMGLRGILDALEDGAKEAVAIAMACAVSGVVIGGLWLTGLSLNFSSIVFSLFQGKPFIGLVLVAMVCILLGMGLPTVAAYIVVASIGVSPLVQLGFPLMAVHFFVFYFSILAVITPPVALAAYAGANIAGASFFLTGFTAVKFGIVAYIVPFMLVYNPELMLIGAPLVIARVFITATIGTIALSSGVQGWLLQKTPIWERIMLVAGGLALISPDPLTDIPGVGLIAAVGAMQWISGKMKRAAGNGSSPD